MHKTEAGEKAKALKKEAQNLAESKDPALHTTTHGGEERILPRNPEGA